MNSPSFWLSQNPALVWLWTYRACLSREVLTVLGSALTGVRRQVIYLSTPQPTRSISKPEDYFGPPDDVVGLLSRFSSPRSLTLTSEVGHWPNYCMGLSWWAAQIWPKLSCGPRVMGSDADVALLHLYCICWVKTVQLACFSRNQARY